MQNKKIFTLILIITTLLSCTNLEKTHNNNAVVFVERDENINIDANKDDLLDHFNSSNFNANNFDYIYEGENLNINQPLLERIVIEKVYAKHPEFIVKTTDPNFSKLPNNSTKDMDITVEPDGSKKVILKNTNYLYAKLKDLKEDKIKEVLIKKDVKVIPIEFMPKDGISYQELKNSRRIEYSIDTLTNTYDDESEMPSDEELSDDSYEISSIYNLGKEAIENYYDEDPDYDFGTDDPDEFDDSLAENLEGNLDYSEYFGYKKYLDEDSYNGYRNVNVRQSINGTNDIVSPVKVKFGKDLSDYSNDYGVLLKDLTKSSLRLNENNEVVGGFDEYTTENLLKFYKTSPEEGSVEFKTVILDDDKDTIGLHNVSRQVIYNGKVVYEKKEKAYVSFDGTNIGVIDGNFFDLSDEVEKRTVRYTDKSYDTFVDYLDKAKQSDSKRGLNEARHGLTRTHGAYVIGSMIDEVSAGDRYYWNGSLLSYLARLGQTDPNTYKNFPSWLKGRKGLVKILENLLSNFDTQYHDTKIAPIKEVIDKKMPELEQILADIKYLVNEIESNVDPVTKKTQISELTDLYKTFDKKVYEIVFYPEDDKLKLTDLHFSTITAGIGEEKVDKSVVEKNLSNLLDLNKNIKVVNGSYGSNADYGEYLALTNMTPQLKEKVVKAYNEDPVYRTAVLGYLKYVQEKEKEHMVDYNGHLTIPSVYSYFESRDKITVDDLDKIIDLKLLGMESAFLKSTELAAFNHDVLFVNSNGNTDDSANLDLINFDEKGKKIPYSNLNYVYNNPLASLTVSLNDKEKEYDNKNNLDYKYNYGYRKNLLSSVGLAPKTITAGNSATEDISANWGLFTIDHNYYRYKAYGEGMLEIYNELVNKINEAAENPNKYSKEYVSDLTNRLKALNDFIEEKSKGKELVSFKRAGLAKLWTMAADGTIAFTKKLTDEEKKYNESNTDPLEDKSDDDYDVGIEVGSSFSSPRMAAVAAKVGTFFPFMSAHDIKTTLLTTAIDDYRIEKDDNGKEIIKGLYGVDENIGWGILDKEAAYAGPARFVKALTHEVDKEDYIANIPYGTYIFGNDIKGSFDPVAHAQSRGYLKYNEAIAMYNTAKYTKEELLDSNFLDGKDDLKSLLEKINITPESIANSIRPKLSNYIPSLPYEERELFKDAGLVKEGNGTLILKGNNTYSEKTQVKEGTLVLQGGLSSAVEVSEGAKFKLDTYFLHRTNPFRILRGQAPVVVGVRARVDNKGEVYSYSRVDKITDKYVPYENSQTKIATIGTLTVNELDLSNINRFGINVFRKKGMISLPLPKNKKLDEYESIDLEDEKVTKIDYNKHLLFYAKKLSLKDTYKLASTKDLTKALELKYELSKIKDSEDYELKVYLARKDGYKFELDYDSPLNKHNEAKSSLGYSENSNKVSLLNLRNHVLENYKNNIISYNTAINLNENLDWLTSSDEETLKGEVLADSILLPIQVANINLKTIVDNLNDKLSNKHNSIFANTIYSATQLNNTDKKVFTSIYGGLFGTTINTKYSKTGFAISYSTSSLGDVQLKVKKNTIDKENIKLGTVINHNIGANLINQLSYNNYYLNTVFGLNYNAKLADRRIEDRNVSNTESADILINLYNQLGYKYSHDINSNFKVSVSPYVSLNILHDIIGGFDENDGYGYKSNSQGFTKANATLGMNLGFTVFDRTNIDIFGDYTKYLTNTSIKHKAELKGYNFETEIDGIDIPDHQYNVGVNIGIKALDSLNISTSYTNSNVNTHTLKLGINYEF